MAREPGRRNRAGICRGGHTAVPERPATLSRVALPRDPLRLHYVVAGNRAEPFDEPAQSEAGDGGRHHDVGWRYIAAAVGRLRGDATHAPCFTPGRVGAAL